MTPDHEAAIRAAAEALAAAILAAATEPPIGPTPERLLSVNEAADATGLGRSRLYAELGSGRLRSVKVGRRRLIAAGAVREFIEGLSQ
jgi:excisionase family DNA binding protein